MTQQRRGEAGVPWPRSALTNGERPRPASGRSPSPSLKGTTRLPRADSAARGGGTRTRLPRKRRTLWSGQRGRTDAVAQPARLSPPLSGECLLDWGAEDWTGGLRTGMGGTTEKGYAHAPITQAEHPPPAPHTHSE